jgi:hypothetical protein
MRDQKVGVNEMINLYELPTEFKKTIAGVVTAGMIGIVSLAIYGVYYIGLYKFLSYCLAVIVVIVSFMLFIVMLKFILWLYKTIYATIFDRSLLVENKKKQLVWNANEGVKPVARIVNAEYADSTIRWNVDPEALNWSKDTPNPIVEYMKKL